MADLSERSNDPNTIDPPEPDSGLIAAFQDGLRGHMEQHVAAQEPHFPPLDSFRLHVYQSLPRMGAQILEVAEKVASCT